MCLLFTEPASVDNNGTTDSVHIEEAEPLSTEPLEIAAEPLQVAASEPLEVVGSEPTVTMSDSAATQTYSLREEIHLNEEGREEHIVFISEPQTAESFNQIPDQSVEQTGYVCATPSAPYWALCGIFHVMSKPPEDFTVL